MSEVPAEDIQRGAKAYKNGLMTGAFAAARVEYGLEAWDSMVAEAVLAAVFPAHDQRIRAQTLHEAADALPVDDRPDLFWIRLWLRRYVERAGLARGGTFDYETGKVIPDAGSTPNCECQRLPAPSGASFACPIHGAGSTPTDTTEANDG